MVSPKMTSQEIASVTGYDVTGITGSVMGPRGWVRSPRGMVQDLPSLRVLFRPLRSIFTYHLLYLSFSCMLPPLRSLLRAMTRAV